MERDFTKGAVWKIILSQAVPLMLAQLIQLLYNVVDLKFYLAGTLFSMLSTGLNGYISAQGYPKTGMVTVIIGAVINIALDPVFIFVLGLGVSGAALATVISQLVSAIWILRFLTNKSTPIRLKKRYIRIEAKLTGEICWLGTSNFVMQGTACFVQAACNSTLHTYGGDIYVGIMTVLNSIRDIFMLPIGGLVSGAQPVMGYNYGAGENGRVKEAIRFNAIVGAVYTGAAWLLIVLFPAFWFRLFSSDTAMVEHGLSAIRIYFFGFIFMSFQFAGQSTFQALGCAGHAVFFSLLRKAVIVVPLTLLLPRLGMGVTGVFIAEPVSNAIGGLACFITMRRTVYKKL